MTVLRELRVVRHYLEGWSLWSAHLVATLISTSIAVVSYVFLLFFFLWHGWRSIQFSLKEYSSFLCYVIGGGLFHSFSFCLQALKVFPRCWKSSLFFQYLFSWLNFKMGAFVVLYAFLFLVLFLFHFLWEFVSLDIYSYTWEQEKVLNWQGRVRTISTKIILNTGENREVAATHRKFHVWSY